MLNLSLVLLFSALVTASPLAPPGAREVASSKPEEFWKGHKVTYVDVSGNGGVNNGIFGFAIKRPDFSSANLYAWAVDAEDGDSLVLSNGSAFRRLGAKTKRYPGACQNVDVHEDKVVHTWTEWGTFSNVSDCIRCDVNTECGGSVQIGKSTSRSLSVGLSASMADEVQKQIMASPELNLGYQWSTTKTWSTTWTCHPKGGHEGRIFGRQCIGHANTQHRDGTLTCINESWGKWKDESGEWPLSKEVGDNDNAVTNKMVWCRAQCAMDPNEKPPS